MEKHPYALFSPPCAVSCGTQEKDTVCLERGGGNMSSRNNVYEHSDPNETPGWESGRQESGNSKAWLVLQGEQLTSDYLWTWHLWTGQDHLASSPTMYPVAQQTRGRQAKNKLFSVSVSHTLMRLRAMQRRDCMFEFTYDCYREIKSQIWIIAGILILTLLSTIADWCR